MRFREEVGIYDRWVAAAYLVSRYEEVHRLEEVPRLRHVVVYEGTVN